MTFRRGDIVWAFAGTKERRCVFLDEVVRPDGSRAIIVLGTTPEPLVPFVRVDRPEDLAAMGLDHATHFPAKVDSVRMEGVRPHGTHRCPPDVLGSSG